MRKNFGQKPWIYPAGFHTTKSEFTDAPIINELPMALECKLIKINEDGNIIDKIINVSADECLLDKNICLHYINI